MIDRFNVGVYNVSTKTKEGDIMKKINKQITEAQMAAIKTAEEEKSFKANEFLEEVQPLLDDYFLGEFKLNDNSIICSFPNGQKVKLVVA